MAEASGGKCGVAQAQPDDFGAFVGECALAHFRNSPVRERRIALRFCAHYDKRAVEVANTWRAIYAVLVG